jgi:hypothetical protein
MPPGSAFWGLLPCHCRYFYLYLPNTHAPQSWVMHKCRRCLEFCPRAASPRASGTTYHGVRDRAMDSKLSEFPMDDPDELDEISFLCT